MSMQTRSWDSCREESGFSVTAVTLWWLPYLGCPLGRRTTGPTAIFSRPHLNSGSRVRGGHC